MSNFVKVKRIARYEKVSYYSVIREGRAQSLFELFISKHQVDNKEKLNHILSWLDVIGKKYGAQQQYFRNEAYISATSALPPQGINRAPTYIEEEEAVSNNLRLYCCRLNERVVFLYDGDIKTEEKAQNCKNVKAHFLEANRITKALDISIIDKNIVWNEDCSDIIFDEELDIEY